MNIPHAEGPGVLSTLEATGSNSQRTQAKGYRVEPPSPGRIRAG
jgi:hypothetical protein